ncbi:hypothetical protein Pla123a_48140 [Posidoniimonas polymericola]|uniref:Uncharacterized protein n=1 Tax=Posidoniimonas polymericola TaxID=2528002 RepID=A0A5C5XU50_9BACT|nr:hypothetical protein [Posidoniimonas polymericola]TWT65903.1 hypothetical protein Pla123a_48140 [Posidoniimonas polymericola]
MDMQLPPDIESQLNRLAASGADVQQFVAQTLREGFERHTQEDPSLSEEEWQAGFKSWVDSFPQRKTTMDDSRESIYEGRGE